jgi:N-acetylglucosaminyldiphosphoundecaprenol N-acetyl-beta-D-mannosaminyltransferase
MWINLGEDIEMRKRINVLDVPVDIVTMEEAVQIIDGYIHEKRTHLIVTANAEMVMQADADKELHAILAQADMVVADGAGVVWAAKYQGCPLRERVAGADLVPRLFELSVQKGYKVFMLGAAPGIAQRAAANIRERFPGVHICGIQDGYFARDEEAAVVARIKEANPDILLIALGVPRQEKWIWRYKDHLNIPVCMGVGGVFDVLAGVAQRAPLWMQKASLEWLYRLLKQPERLGRMSALPKFVLRVLASNRTKND